nr:alpha-ketoglutarate-dependent dioxygenase AlkB [Tanacetum cinerariifolium]
GYNVLLPHNKIPDAFSQLAKKMAAPAMPVGEDFQPEVAIVICWVVTLMNWKWIRANLFLGCKAIFLLEGKSRTDEPLAMFLRTGMVVLMSGEARERFHCVPQIFNDAEHAEIGSLEKQLSDEDNIVTWNTSKLQIININKCLNKSLINYKCILIFLMFLTINVI